VRCDGKPVRSGGPERCALELEAWFLLGAAILDCPLVSGFSVTGTSGVLPAAMMAIWSRDWEAFVVVAVSALASAAGRVELSPLVAGCWFLAGWQGMAGAAESVV
jgi:hypothetical protein